MLALSSFQIPPPKSFSASRIRSTVDLLRAPFWNVVRSDKKWRPRIQLTSLLSHCSPSSGKVHGVPSGTPMKFPDRDGVEREVRFIKLGFSEMKAGRHGGSPAASQLINPQTAGFPNGFVVPTWWPSFDNVRRCQMFVSPYIFMGKGCMSICSV